MKDNYCFSLQGEIQADYQLAVSVTSYSNPGNQEFDGDCCDDIIGSCNEDCDPYIGALYLRQFGDPHDQSCPLGLPNTDIGHSIHCIDHWNRSMASEYIHGWWKLYTYI